MQGDPSVRGGPLYPTPPPKGLPGVPEGALIRLDREVYGLVSGMSGWRSRIFPLERTRLRDECVWTLPFQQVLLSVRNQRSMEARSHLESLLVVCCSKWTTTWWVALERHIMKAWRDYGRGSNLESGTGCYKTGPPFSVDATSHSYRIEALRLTWRDLSESLRSISLPHGRCLDSSAEASEVEVKALRAVAGSLSWVARQCCLDEAGTASTLQSSVSRAVVKNLSDANRAVNRLKQTEDVGLLIHTILLVNLRTMSISAAVLDLDRPDGSRQGGFMVGYLHQQGSAAMFPMFRLSPLWLEMSSWWAKVWLSVNVSVVYWNRRSIKTTSHRYRLICPQCTIDAKSAFDHLVRVSTGRLCTRTAL